MAYDRQQIKLSAIGRIGTTGGGNEIWSWGLHLSGTVAFDAVEALAAIDAAAIDTAIHVFHQSAGAAIHNSVSYDTLKLAALDVNGSYLGDPRLVQSNGTTGYSGIGNTRHPNQIALCVSLRTVTSIGVAVRGRFYVPMPGFVPDNDGRIAPASTLSMLNAAVTMLDAINTAADTGATASVIQLMSDQGVSTPRSRVVTKVLVGDVFDTMRSRRNALQETYTSADLAT